jgi:hypothetical protein
VLGGLIQDGWYLNKKRRRHSGEDTWRDVMLRHEEQGHGTPKATSKPSVMIENDKDSVSELSEETICDGGMVQVVCLASLRP